MQKKAVLVAGVVMAAGVVAAFSAPSFRGDRLESLFEDLVDGFDKLGQRAGAEDAGGAVARDVAKGRRNRGSARADDAVEAEADDGARGDRRSRRAAQRLEAERESGLAMDGVP